MTELLMRPDDTAIREDVEAAKSGDEQAFTRLIATVQNTVTCIALAMVKDLDESQDVAQKVYIAVWKNIQSLNNNDSFLPWVRQTTRYQALNHLRDNNIKQKISGEECEQVIADFCHPDLANDHVLERNQQSAILEKFINDLPNESREIVLLYYREEQSAKQVSRLLGISETNVRKKLSRARGVLKEKLLKKYGRLILSTAPTFGFTSVLFKALSASSPVAAATLATSYSSAKMSFFSKFLLLLGGSMIGAAFGIIALYWQANRCIKQVTNTQTKKQLVKNRNQTILWIVLSGLLLTASYELTSGWIMPMSSYSIFLIGLFISIRKSWKIFDRERYNEIQNTIASRKKLWKIYPRLFCTIMGLSSGFLCLCIGLVNSGRL